MRFVVGQVLCCCHQQGTSLRGLCGLLSGVESSSMTFYPFRKALDGWNVDCGVLESTDDERNDRFTQLPQHQDMYTN